MAINPNWPILEHAWGPSWNVNAATIPIDRYVDVSQRSRGTTSADRGRQYELDQIRAGNTTTAWDNTDGAFDPMNSAGPWYGSVKLFQPYRLRAQWPPTQNLLTPVQATGGDNGGYSTGTIPQGNSGIAVNSATDSSGGTITASGTAWQGARVFQFAVPASTASGTSICATSQPAVQPGATYTQQLQVRNVTSSTSLQVAAYIAWYNAAGTLISTSAGTASTLTGSASASWTQITVTGTAPTNTAYWALGVRTAAASPGSSINVQVDGWQIEQGSAPTAWTAPGTWYPILAGFVDRYPPQWGMSGTYGTVTPQVYDAFSLLSQCTLADPLTEEINSRNPRFVYALSDPANSSYVADISGQKPLAQILNSRDGAGSLTLGVQITAAATSGIYTGSTGTVATIANANPGQNTTGAATYIALGSAGITGPAGQTWSRALAFRYTASTPAYRAMLWAGAGTFYFESPAGGQTLQLYIDNSGHVNLFRTDSTGSGGTATTTGASVCDSNWHLVQFGYDATTGKSFINLDGTDQRFVSGVGASPTSLATDNIGAFVNPVYGGSTVRNMQGDISFAVEWPILLSTSDCAAIYTAWRSSCSGDSSNTRYARILGWAGYTGPTNLQTGLTTSMSAAAVGGQNALTALQAVTDTENGNHYVARDGTITFKARSDRYNSLTPTYTFGERTDLGEYPYENIQLDYDSTHIANSVTVTQESTQQEFSATDTTSIGNYFTRALTRTISTTSATECQDSANYLLSRHKEPAVRVSSITLHPSANTTLWPVCLSLELGMRIRVMRRPPAPAATVQADCFVEAISWQLDDQNEAIVTLQCSPVDTTPYGILGAWRAPMTSGTTVGATGVIIARQPFQNNGDPAAATIPSGVQMVVGLGTANAETVTIQRVGTTTSGWNAVQLFLTAPLTKTHAAGDIVCEALPAGVTDPATWDAVAKLDQKTFAY